MVLLLTGITTSMITSQAYALPAKRCFAQFSPDTATVTISVDDTDYDTLTLAGGGALVSGAFIKSATASTKIRLTPA